MKSAKSATSTAGGGFAYWRQGLRLWRGRPMALAALAILACYASVLPDLVSMFLPGWQPGAGRALLLTLAAFWLQGLCYALLIGRIDAIAGGHGRGQRPAELVGVAVSLVVADIIYCVAGIAGAALLLVPGLVLSVVWLFFAYPIVLDRLGPLAGLDASRRLVAGRFWSTCRAISVTYVVYSVYVVITWVPMLVAIDRMALTRLAGGSALGGLAAAEQMAAALDSPAAAAPVWNFVVNPLLAGLVMPPVLAALYSVYRSLCAAQPARADESDSPLSAAN